MRLSASQLGAYNRCPKQYYYERIEKRKGRLLSATALGTVVHYALHAFERVMADDGADWESALNIGLATFDTWWTAAGIESMCEQPYSEIVWLPRGNKGKDSYGNCRQRGLDIVAEYADLWKLDRCNLLALEHPFEVPVIGTEHTISGFVDRLVERKTKSSRGKPSVWVLDADDWKTGKRQYNLRHNIQFTVYCYASTRLEFWLPFEAVGLDPEKLLAHYAEWPRHSWWYDLTEFKRVDAGYRGPQDYHRMAWAVSEVARSVEAGIFPLRISGDTCVFCPHADFCPDGTGLPEPSHGDPNAA